MVRGERRRVVLPPFFAVPLHGLAERFPAYFWRCDGAVLGCGTRALPGPFRPCDDVFDRSIQKRGGTRTALTLTDDVARYAVIARLGVRITVRQAAQRTRKGFKCGCRGHVLR